MLFKKEVLQRFHDSNKINNKRQTNSQLSLKIVTMNGPFLYKKRTCNNCSAIFFHEKFQNLFSESNAQAINRNPQHFLKSFSTSQRTICSDTNIHAYFDQLTKCIPCNYTWYFFSYCGFFIVIIF